MNTENRQCQNCKSQFAIEPDDFTFYAKVKVPPPTFCHLCRAQRRFSFRNERILYKRKSDFSPQPGSLDATRDQSGQAGKEIFTMYAPESNVKVYEKEVWMSDAWEPLDYGVDVDFSKPFLEQVKELLHKVPLKNLNSVNAVQSDYCNNITEPKNSYLVFNASNPEDCMYGHGINFSRDCVDVSHVSKCETCYDDFWLTACNQTHFSSECENCLNMWFSKNCVGCTSCFGCVGLRNRQYYIFNEPYSKEEYLKRVTAFDIGSYEKMKAMKARATEFWLKFPNKFMQGLHNLRVSGNYIDHSKDVRDSFLVRDGEHMRFCQYVQESPGSKDCYDYSIWGDRNELVYECHACGIGTRNIKFCLFTQEDSHDVEYSMVCSGSSSIFGCVGLRKKEYCILNRQYSKDEYETLAQKIREHMSTTPYVDAKGRVYTYGEFFPIEMSPVAYNESLAQEYFPLTKNQAEAEGYRWKDTEEKDYKVTVPFDKLPDHIKDVSDSITKEIVSCAHAFQRESASSPRGSAVCNQLCATAFKIIPDELQFYRKIGVPLPRLCPNCRTFERLQQRTGLKLFTRKCMCAGSASEAGSYTNTALHVHGADHCPNQFETAYGTDRSEIVYCEQCYQAEFV